MHVAELWRYPVKSMAGERLPATDLTPEGVPGDRLVYVVDRRGEIVSARTRPGLLRLRGALDEVGAPLVQDWAWDSGPVARTVEALVGPGARLVRHRGLERFDMLPLMVATDGAIDALGVDGRRLRPNLVVGGVEGLAERDWAGRLLRVGGAVVGLRDLRQRCVMTTFDPDTVEQDVEVLKRINREHTGRFALNGWVSDPGRVQVGDPVELLPADHPVAIGPPSGGRYDD